ncbi:hypothetical protein BLOT_012959 [Blomia tropicalis]|nr:hypothetical protein BLOT_012959 [Blomia tropicalis]
MRRRKLFPLLALLLLASIQLITNVLGKSDDDDIGSQGISIGQLIPSSLVDPGLKWLNRKNGGKRSIDELNQEEQMAIDERNKPFPDPCLDLRILVNQLDQQLDGSVFAAKSIASVVKDEFGLSSWIGRRDEYIERIDDILELTEFDQAYIQIMQKMLREVGRNMEDVAQQIVLDMITSRSSISMRNKDSFERQHLKCLMNLTKKLDKTLSRSIDQHMVAKDLGARNTIRRLEHFRFQLAELSEQLKLLKDLH